MNPTDQLEWLNRSDGFESKISDLPRVPVLLVPPWRPASFLLLTRRRCTALAGNS